MGVASPSHDSKRSRRDNEEQNEDVSLPQQSLRQFGLHWITKQEDRLHNFGLDFVFNDPGECNLNMWARHQQDGYHVSFPYAHMSREVGIWLKIIYACLVPGKHVTHFTYERECLFYALMTWMPINVEAIIKDVLRRARVKNGQRFGFGGLLTRFLKGHQIEEKVVYFRPRYDPKRIDVTNTADPEVIHGPVLSIKEQLQKLNMEYPLSEHSVALCRVEPGFDELLDDDDATEEEQVRVDSNLESNNDKDNSETGEAALGPTDDED
ncbi:hypothetical protein HAX54_006725 [Datura stramonium]|uniref:Putative plant transposon protein domain-containing protein n=1 Tax=Datura stramonium TaxID=4076 RepID=A0ABS8TBH0_DATST|nr:hypothetical protein [Datura stramonium]